MQTIPLSYIERQLIYINVTQVNALDVIAWCTTCGHALRIWFTLEHGTQNVHMLVSRLDFNTVHTIYLTC